MIYDNNAATSNVQTETTYPVYRKMAELREKFDSEHGLAVHQGSKHDDEEIESNTEEATMTESNTDRTNAKAMADGGTEQIRGSNEVEEGKNVPDGYDIRALVEAGASGAETIDYLITKHYDLMTQADWSEVRGKRSSAISNSVSGAKKEVSD